MTTTPAARRPHGHHGHRHVHTLMRAVVLVGGFGTRMRPLTNHVPKSMLPVGHEPMISRLVGRLVEGGVTDVTLALGFKAEPFLTAFPDGRCGGARLDYAVEPEPLDTAGAIRFAAEHSGIDDTFVVVNGDIITDLDVSTLVAAHRALRRRGHDPPHAGRRPVVVRGRRDRRRRSCRAVRREAACRNHDVEPDQRRHATCSSRPSSSASRPGGRSSIERETFPDLVERAALYALATDDYWIDAGRPELYLRANLDLVNGRRSERVDTGRARR